MIGKLARRLGFEQSVPVSLIDGWVVPTLSKTPIELAPREGAASFTVDQFGRIQIGDASFTIDLTLAAGARWVSAAESDRVKQTVIAPGIVATTVQTPSGPIVQRVAAGVVDGQPVAVVEIENTGGVAIAAGIVARPLRLDGRGAIAEVAIGTRGLSVDGRRVVRFDNAPASVAASDGAAGDMLQRLPNPETAVVEATAKCRSGGAQAAAVWPLPHTATLRFVIELALATSAEASVPTTNDINRGWESHLKQGLRVDVDEFEVAEHLALATRSVLTLWPERADAPLATLALAEMGFGRDAGRFFDDLERCDDDDRVIRSLARWAQLGEQAHQLDDLERMLGRLAQAAHHVAGRGGELAGSPWLDDALVALGGRLHQIDQPDVAERVQGLSVATQPSSGQADALAALTKSRDKRGVWADGQMAAAAAYVRALRAVVVEDTGTEVQLLPDMPLMWRGRTIDVFGLPIANGTLSFGVRWHGPRPALLWEASLAPEAPLRITVPGIDPDFSTREREGEVLLADPGWKTNPSS